MACVTNVRSIHVGNPSTSYFTDEFENRGQFKFEIKLYSVTARHSLLSALARETWSRTV